MIGLGNRAVRRDGLALVLGLVVGGLAFAAVPAASAQTLNDLEVRDRLIADQEALLNTYRCMFNVDTQVVPDGCSNGSPVLSPQDPGQFSGTPTAQDITIRDQLIANQEALLNVYRCQFNIDTELVPNGCQNDDTDTDAVDIDDLGPIPPNEAYWSEILRIREFIIACGWHEGVYKQCSNHPEDTQIVIQALGTLHGCTWDVAWGMCEGYTFLEFDMLRSSLACPEN